MDKVLQYFIVGKKGFKQINDKKCEKSKQPFCLKYRDYGGSQVKFGNECRNIDWRRDKLETDHYEREKSAS